MIDTLFERIMERHEAYLKLCAKAEAFIRALESTSIKPQ